jgi:hypothetical protein
MAVTLPELKVAQAMAARWEMPAPSALGQFIEDGSIEPHILAEVKGLYVQPLSPQQKAELLLLGMYLAAEIFRNDAEMESAANRIT